jgi:hypothetical protein
MLVTNTSVMKTCYFHEKICRRRGIAKLDISNRFIPQGTIQYTTMFTKKQWDPKYCCLIHVKFYKRLYEFHTSRTSELTIAYGASVKTSIASCWPIAIVVLFLCTCSDSIALSVRYCVAI